MEARREEAGRSSGIEGLAIGIVTTDVEDEDEDGGEIEAEAEQEAGEERAVGTGLRAAGGEGALGTGGGGGGGEGAGCALSGTFSKKAGFPSANQAESGTKGAAISKRNGSESGK